MKNFLRFGSFAAIAAAAVMSLALSSCGDDNKEEGGSKSLSVSVSSVSLDYSGTAQLVDVTSEGAAWVAAASDEWVHVTPTLGEASSPVAISADANRSRTSRVSTVTFSAEGVTPVNVIVLQEANNENRDVDTRFKYVEFDYLGDNHNTVNQYATFYLRATDSKLDDNGYMSTYPCNSVLLSLNVPYQAVEYVSSGLFNSFAGSETIAEQTFYLPDSQIAKYESASVYEVYNVESGTCTVKSFGSSMVAISMDLVLDDGSKFVAAYTGGANLYDMREDTGEESSTSTLTADYALTLTDVTAANIYDSQSTTAVSLTQIDFAGKNINEKYDYLWLLLFTSPNASADKDLSGTYTPAEDDYVVGRFLYGYVSSNKMYGTWWVETDGDTNISGYANLVGGSVTVTKESNGNYTFDCNFTDPKGHKVTGKITTPITLKVNPSSSGTSSVNPSSVKAGRYSVQIADFGKDRTWKMMKGASPVKF